MEVIFMGKNYVNMLRNNEDFFESKYYYDKFDHKWNEDDYDYHILKINDISFFKWLDKYIRYNNGVHINTFYSNFKKINSRFNIKLKYD